MDVYVCGEKKFRVLIISFQTLYFPKMLIQAIPQSRVLDVRVCRQVWGVNFSFAVICLAASLIPEVHIPG